MLNIATHFSQLRVLELMDVYASSTRLSAQARFPGLDISEAVLRIEEEMIDYLQNDFFRTKGAFCAMWEEYGTYVSALRMEPYEDGFLLSGLETASDVQNRGYAGMLICAVLEKMPPDVPVYSHVARRNRASLHVHKKYGFQTLFHYAVYLDGTRDAGSDTLIFKKPDLPGPPSSKF